MKCPHCHQAFHAAKTAHEIGNVGETEKWRYFWTAYAITCPACHKPIIYVEYQENYGSYARFLERGLWFSQKEPKDHQRHRKSQRQLREISMKRVLSLTIVRKHPQP